MKCIKCNTNNTFKERNNTVIRQGINIANRRVATLISLRPNNYDRGKCKKCGHQFVFEPKQLYFEVGFKFTDKFFADRISKISANSTLFFTEKQFLYFFETSYRTKSISLLSCFFKFTVWIVIGCIIFSFTSVKVTSSDPGTDWLSLFIFALILILFILFVLTIIFILIRLILFVFKILRAIFTIFTDKSIRKLIITSDKIREWLNNWIAVNGEIEKLLPPLKSAIDLNKIDIDIAKYSFDRLIVCEKDEIAQFLIANNFHLENNCAIVSINGYPQNIFNTVMLMVKSNPDLKIYALHDASPNGIKILDTLKTNSDWFGDSNLVIYNLGLLPSQIFKTKNLWIQQSDESANLAKKNLNAIENYLSDKEIKWLNSGKFIELESFRPQKLIQIVTLGINKSQVYQKTDSECQIYLDSNISEGVTLELDTFG